MLIPVREELVCKISEDGQRPMLNTPRVRHIQVRKKMKYIKKDSTKTNQTTEILPDTLDS